MGRKGIYSRGTGKHIGGGKNVGVAKGETEEVSRGQITSWNFTVMATGHQ